MDDEQHAHVGALLRVRMEHAPMNDHARALKRRLARRAEAKSNPVSKWLNANGITGWYVPENPNIRVISTGDGSGIVFLPLLKPFDDISDVHELVKRYGGTFEFDYGDGYEARMPR